MPRSAPGQTLSVDRALLLTLHLSPRPIDGRGNGTPINTSLSRRSLQGPRPFPLFRGTSRIKSPPLFYSPFLWSLRSLPAPSPRQCAAPPATAPASSIRQPTPPSAAFALPSAPRANHRVGIRMQWETCDGSSLTLGPREHERMHMDMHMCTREDSLSHAHPTPSSSIPPFLTHIHADEALIVSALQGGFYPAGCLKQLRPDTIRPFRTALLMLNSGRIHHGLPARLAVPFADAAWGVAFT